MTALTPLTTSNYFEKYAFDPWSKDLSKDDKVTAYAVTFFATLFTVGLFALGVTAYQWCCITMSPPAHPTIIDDNANDAIDILDGIARCFDHTRDTRLRSGRYKEAAQLIELLEKIDLSILTPGERKAFKTGMDLVYTSSVADWMLGSMRSSEIRQAMDLKARIGVVFDNFRELENS